VCGSSPLVGDGGVKGPRGCFGAFFAGDGGVNAPVVVVAGVVVAVVDVDGGVSAPVVL
jgi:hypothetical protein